MHRTLALFIFASTAAPLLAAPTEESSTCHAQDRQTEVPSCGNGTDPDLEWRFDQVVFVTSTTSNGGTPLEINHYDQYCWDELVSQGLVQFWQELGWTKAAWEAGEEPPAWEKDWHDLTDMEQEAATSLGFAEQTWDDNNEEEDDEDEDDEDDEQEDVCEEEEDLEGEEGDDDGWPVFVELVQSSLEVNYDEYSWTDLQENGLDVHWRALGWNKTAWETGEAPAKWYTTWDELTETERQSAEALGFIEQTWNGMEWSELAGHVWDCYIAHYDGYSWEELETQQVREYWQELGWTQAQWEGDVSHAPDSWTKAWSELSQQEQGAAGKLCYFEDTWGQERFLAESESGGDDDHNHNHTGGEEETNGVFVVSVNSRALSQ